MTPEPKDIMIDEVRDGLRHLKCELVDGLTWWIVSDGQVAIQYSETVIPWLREDPLVTPMSIERTLGERSLFRGDVMVDGGTHVSRDLDASGPAMDACFVIDDGQCTFWGNSVLGQKIADSIEPSLRETDGDRDEAIFWIERILVLAAQVRYGVST